MTIRIAVECLGYAWLAVTAGHYLLGRIRRRRSK